MLGAASMSFRAGVDAEGGTSCSSPLIDTELKLDLKGWPRLFVCDERFPQSNRSHMLGTAGVSHLKLWK